MKQEEWPFDQPKNCASIIHRQILNGEIEITTVYHDKDDHSWQFLGCAEISEENAAVVSLVEVANLDPTVLEIANIKPGYHAFRVSKNKPWQINKT